jgi:hypothetical protein
MPEDGSPIDWDRAIFVPVEEAELFSPTVPDPEAATRMSQLLHDSEELPFEEQWERVWFHDQPSWLTPYRVEGGIAPGPDN